MRNVLDPRNTHQIIISRLSQNLNHYGESNTFFSIYFFWRKGGSLFIFVYKEKEKIKANRQKKKIKLKIYIRIIK